MATFGIILFSIGLLGLLGATVFFPLVARGVLALHSLFSKSNRPAQPERRGAGQRGDAIRSLSVLIPVYDDPALFSQTLRSVANARSWFLSQIQRVSESEASSDAAMEIDIVVFIDGDSAELRRVAEFCGVTVLSSEKRRGKWFALERLVAAARESDTVLFLDAGSVIDEKFFLRLQGEYRRPSKPLGVAPTYRPIRAHPVSSAHWWIERTLKSLENAAGGPVSVHGAGVSYRTAELFRVMQQLGQPQNCKAAGISQEGWSNDDVVIPFMMRIMFPRQSLHYSAHLSVADMGNSPARGPGAKSTQAQCVYRRERMARGNRQWLALFLKVVREEDTMERLPIYLVALRRVFRFLWAYWALALLLGALVLLLHSFGVLVAVLSFALLIPFILTCGSRDTGAAFRASLLGLRGGGARGGREVWS